MTTTTMWRYDRIDVPADASDTNPFMRPLAWAPVKSGRAMGVTPNWLAEPAANFTVALRVTFPSFPSGSPAVNLRYMFNAGEQGLNISVKSGAMQIKWPGAATSMFYSFAQGTAPLSLCLLYSWVRATSSASVSIGRLESNGSITALTDDAGKSMLTFSNVTTLPGTNGTSWEMTDFTLLARSPSVVIDDILLSADVMTLQSAFGTAQGGGTTTQGGGTVSTQTVNLGNRIMDIGSNYFAFGTATGTAFAQHSKLVSPTPGILQISGGTDSEPCRITGLADPTQPSDAATRSWVQTQISNSTNSLTLKRPVAVAVDTNVTPATIPATVDGVTLQPGMRVLFINQTSRVSNGIWVLSRVGTTGWAFGRPDDFFVGSGARPSPGQRPAGMARRSSASMFVIGVTPATDSEGNDVIEYAYAPTILPLMNTGLPDMPATTFAAARRSCPVVLTRMRSWPG